MTTSIQSASTWLAASTTTGSPPTTSARASTGSRPRRRRGRRSTSTGRPGWSPTPNELAVEPDVGDPLPRADVLVVTWTAAEMLALADTLTPGVNPRTRWYRYARDFEQYLPEIRGGAPARAVGRLGSYYPTRIGRQSVLCVKSELHLNQDGVTTGAGTATLPIARFIEQMYDEVKPKLVITVGTAGGTLPNAELGDVMITRTRKFRARRSSATRPFTDRRTRRRPRSGASTSRRRRRSWRPTPTSSSSPTSARRPSSTTSRAATLAGHVNTPSILVEGTDFPRACRCSPPTSSSSARRPTGSTSTAAASRWATPCSGSWATKLGATGAEVARHPQRLRPARSTATCRSARRARSTCRPTGRSGTTRRSATGRASTARSPRGPRSPRDPSRPGSMISTSISCVRTISRPRIRRAPSGRRRRPSTSLRVLMRPADRDDRLVAGAVGPGTRGRAGP